LDTRQRDLLYEAKETYCRGKRDLLYEAKETYYRRQKRPTVGGKRDLAMFMQHVQLGTSAQVLLFVHSLHSCNFLLLVQVFNIEKGAEHILW